MADTVKVGGLKAAEKFARQLFTDNPDMTIDEAARRIHNECSQPLTRGHIVSIRRWMRGSEAPKVVVKPAGAPFNPPRIVKEEPVPASKREESTPAERRKFLEDYCLQHPGTSVNEARDLLHKNFDVAIGTAAIAEIVRTARQLHDEQRAIPVHAPLELVSAAARPSSIVSDVVDKLSHQGFDDLARRMKAAGVQYMRINGDTFRVVLEGKL